MDERKAWLYLEKKWRRAKKGGHDEYGIKGVWGVNIDGVWCNCLCSSITMMGLDLDLASLMKNKIWDYLETNPPGTYSAYGSVYLDKITTKRGALRRANFCRKQAQLLNKEKKS